MSAIKEKNVTKIETSYAKQQEVEMISKGRKRKYLYRRLAAFTILAVTVSFFMISTLVSQSSILKEKAAEEKKLKEELKSLKKRQTILEDEIVKLNDDEYIAKLARKEYFLSEDNEIIFTLPEKKEKEK